MVAPDVLVAKRGGGASPEGTLQGARHVANWVSMESPLAVAPPGGAATPSFPSATKARRKPGAGPSPGSPSEETKKAFALGTMAGIDANIATVLVVHRMRAATRDVVANQAMSS